MMYMGMYTEVYEVREADDVGGEDMMNSTIPHSTTHNTYLLAENLRLLGEPAILLKSLLLFFTPVGCVGGSLRHKGEEVRQTRSSVV